MAEFGRVDCVIANSGVAAATRSLLDLTSEEYHRVIDVNQHGAFYVLRDGAKLMVKRAEAGEHGGSLIACGSLSMFMGLAGKQAYAGAKAALGAMIRGFAVEFGKYGIRANAIAPGFITTPLTTTSWLRVRRCRARERRRISRLSPPIWRATPHPSTPATPSSSTAPIS